MGLCVTAPAVSQVTASLTHISVDTYRRLRVSVFVRDGVIALSATEIIFILAAILVQFWA